MIDALFLLLFSLITWCSTNVLCSMYIQCMWLSPYFWFCSLSMEPSKSSWGPWCGENYRIMVIKSFICRAAKSWPKCDITLTCCNSLFVYNVLSSPAVAFYMLFVNTGVYWLPCSTWLLYLLLNLPHSIYSIGLLYQTQPVFVFLNHSALCTYTCT